MWQKTNRKDELVCSDGFQDAPPQNMKPWRIEYFKQKEFEEKQVQTGL